MEERLKRYIDVLGQRRALYELRSKNLETSGTTVSVSRLFADLQDEVNTIIQELSDFVKWDDPNIDNYKVVFQGDLLRTHKKVLQAHTYGGEYGIAEKYFTELDEALMWLEDNINPDCEDDRIVIYELLKSGHLKPVWHFSGWHWNYDEVDGIKLEQGCLLNHDVNWYSELMRDY